MKTSEVKKIYGISIDSFKKSRAEKLQKDILSYNEKAYNFKCKQLLKSTYIISVCHSTVDTKHGAKLAIYRNEVFCFSTYETIFFEGNVIDLKHAKKTTFCQVLQKTKNTLNYHFNNLFNN